MPTKKHQFQRLSLFLCLLLFGLQFGLESDSSELEELDIPRILTLENTSTKESSSTKSLDRELASIPTDPSLKREELHDCEAAREAHTYDDIAAEPFSEDEAMERFLAHPKGEAMMDEFLNTVEVSKGVRVLKTDVAQDFEQSLESLDHQSASDAM